jgi:hypothetical protein
MPAGLMIFERAGRGLKLDPTARGHHVVYRANEVNRCPGCGHAQWLLGRVTAECGLCGTAVPLAEAQWSGGAYSPPLAFEEEADGAERRRHERIETGDRRLQLLIDGSPQSFALRDISAGGVKGDGAAGLTPGDSVQVRFEGGILVPAVVRWVEGELMGLAFSSPVLFDTARMGEV